MSAGDSQDKIRAYDRDGQLRLFERTSYRDYGLLPALEEARDDPDRLYSVIVSALWDRFFEDAISPARRLLEMDGATERASNVLGLALMESGSLPEAESVFDAYLASGAESGVIRANLAKVYVYSGNKTRGVHALWESLRVDPNQDAALTWWGALRRDESGETGFLESMREVAALPGSWRAQLWLARDLLGHGQLAQAMALYEAALPLLGGDGVGLMMISGDLGKAGHHRSMVDLVAPAYAPAVHGAETGLNLLASYRQLGEFAQARVVLAEIGALGRLDLLEVLGRYEAELNAASASA